MVLNKSDKKSATAPKLVPTTAHLTAFPTLNWFHEVEVTTFKAASF